MESWFLLALASALSGGVGAFTHKVVAVRGYDINVLNVVSSIISASGLFFCTWYFADFSSFWHLATLFALIGSVTYLLTLVFKIEALSVLDATIFFPLYKVAGPVLVLLIGVLVFAESFTVTQWVGLIMSFCIPLLLISASENKRQQNLKKGIIYVLLAASIGSVSIALFKYGIDISLNPWLFLLVSDLFLATASVGVLFKKHKTTTISYATQIVTSKTILLVCIMGIAQIISASTMIFAFVAGGTLSLVYVISSLYIIVPIALSLFIYQEHWNFRKLLAIVLSVAVLVLLK